jgi:hypothetical protein
MHVLTGSVMLEPFRSVLSAIRLDLGLVVALVILLAILIMGFRIEP